MKKRRFPVFWCVYTVLVIAALVLIHVALGQVETYLAQYEASQPKHAAKAAFEENFAQFDALEYLEKFDESIFGLETKENVAAYLSEKTEGKEFSYYSISSAESGTYKYAVKAGDVKIAEFYLHESVGENGFPTYSAGDFSIFFATNEDVTVTIPKGANLALNGNSISDSYIVNDNIPDSHNEYLPEGVEGKYYTTYNVGGFVKSPEIKVTNGDVDLMVIEGEDGFETAPVYNNELQSIHGEYVLSALQKYATYIQGRYSNGGITLGMVTQYFDPASDVYASIKKVSNKYVNSYDSYEFTNEKTEEFIQYDDNTFSCRVSFSQVLHCNGKQDYVDNIDYTLYLRRIGDKFLIYDMQHE